MSRYPASRAVLFLLIVGLGCAADLWTKHWIFDTLGLPDGRRWWIIEPWVGFETSLNEGALFGIGQGQVLIFATLSIVAGLAIPFWLFARGGANDRWLTIALSSIMAGILGNLYDRLGLWWVPAYEPHPQHAVRDWILLQYPGLPPWPNFNLADSFLVCGAIMILLHTYVSGRRNSFDNPSSGSA